MANSNTAFRCPSLPGTGIPLTTSTSAVQFTDAKGNKAEIRIPASAIDKKRFRISAGGKVVAGEASNLTVLMYFGTTSGTLGSQIASTGTLATGGTTAGGWHLELEGFLDSTSKKLIATASGGVYATMTTVAVGTNTSLDPSAELIAQLSATFSAGNAANSATLEYFEVEIL